MKGRGGAPSRWMFGLLWWVSLSSCRPDYPGERPGSLRIMPFGDSITANSCYRAQLWQRLDTAHRTADIDFVGSRRGGRTCDVQGGYDDDHEGHIGYLATDLLKDSSTGRPSGADWFDRFDASAHDLSRWLAGRPADVVLMHFGTNDLWKGFRPESILRAYSVALTALRRNNPKLTVLAAQIIPMAPADCPACGARVQRLNALIPGWAKANSHPQSAIRVVDQWHGFDPRADTLDGVHPNARGSQKIASCWYTALQ